MEQKKVNLSLLFSLIAFALGVGIKGFAGYFGGSFGIPFVAVVTMIALAMFLAFSKKENLKRVVDIIVLDIVIAVLWIIIFCAYDWAIDITSELVDFAQVMMNVISVLSLIFMVWAIFRFYCEFSNKKVKFVEVVLGNEKIERKPKEKKQPKEKPVKNLKEVENGDLLDKPSREVESVTPQEKAEEHSLDNLTENVEQSSDDSTENVNQIDADKNEAGTQNDLNENGTKKTSSPFNPDNLDRYNY